MEAEIMPYIKQQSRLEIETGYDDRTRSAETPGELNYNITFLLREYLGNAPNYDKFNSVLGVLEAAKLELYRRMVAPYEDTKIKENGDVY
jgi:hypothetical protein